MNFPNVVKQIIYLPLKFHVIAGYTSKINICIYYYFLVGKNGGTPAHRRLRWL